MRSWRRRLVLWALMPSFPAHSSPSLSLLAVKIKKPIQTKFRMPIFNWVALKPTQINGTVFNELNDEKVLQVRLPCSRRIGGGAEQALSSAGLGTSAWRLPEGPAGRTGSLVSRDSAWAPEPGSTQPWHSPASSPSPGR